MLQIGFMIFWRSFNKAYMYTFQGDCITNFLGHDLIVIFMQNFIINEDNSIHMV
jgi:hypothetical protein